LIIFNASIIAEKPSKSTPTIRTINTFRLMRLGLARKVKNAFIPSAELTGKVA
jgi:hypothetical protein